MDYEAEILEGVWIRKRIELTNFSGMAGYMKVMECYAGI